MKQAVESRVEVIGQVGTTFRIHRFPLCPFPGPTRLGVHLQWKLPVCGPQGPVPENHFHGQTQYPWASFTQAERKEHWSIRVFTQFTRNIKGFSVLCEQGPNTISGSSQFLKSGAVPHLASATARFRFDFVELGLPERTVMTTHLKSPSSESKRFPRLSFRPFGMISHCEVQNCARCQGVTSLQQRRRNARQETKGPIFRLLWNYTLHNANERDIKHQNM